MSNSGLCYNRHNSPVNIDQSWSPCAMSRGVFADKCLLISNQERERIKAAVGQEIRASPGR